MRLDPISPCCGVLFSSKIGTMIIVCENCNLEYLICKITTKEDMKSLDEDVRRSMK